MKVDALALRIKFLLVSWRSWKPRVSPPQPAAQVSPAGERATTRNSSANNTPAPSSADRAPATSSVNNTPAPNSARAAAGAAGAKTDFFPAFVSAPASAIAAQRAPKLEREARYLQAIEKGDRECYAGERQLREWIAANPDFKQPKDKIFKKDRMTTF